ncbi:MAG: histidine kinase [Bacteroidaceae bacterium]|nr:histidine kinase [Bacteroidaceae bacterium]
MNKESIQTKELRGKLYRNIEIAIHILTWLYIFASPLLFKRSGEAVDFTRYLLRSMFPLSTCLIFYLNYLWLFPKYFLKKRYKQFLLLNAGIILLVIIGREIQIMYTLPPEFLKSRNGNLSPHIHKHGIIPSPIFFILRSLFSYIFVVGLVVVIGLSKQWRISETARKEAEFQKTEAELKNLKSQINPHFLLNTLNNIYALTAFDKDKAQEAIQELSKMLRYMLYGNHTEYVYLKKEADFINTYISLMRLRQPKNVELSIDINIEGSEHLQIVPLLFISLVENAFKHGVSPTQPSFIHISLKVENDTVIFSARNSNFPKNSSDKAPGGIGLQQVRSLLNYSYPGNHRWTYGPTPDNKIYVSTIEIKSYKEHLPA